MLGLRRRVAASPTPQQTTTILNDLAALLTAQKAQTAQLTALAASVAGITKSVSGIPALLATFQAQLNTFQSQLATYQTQQATFTKEIAQIMTEDAAVAAVTAQLGIDTQKLSTNEAALMAVVQTLQADVNNNPNANQILSPATLAALQAAQGVVDTFTATQTTDVTTAQGDVPPSPAS
jgi:chromosome segregation ATPase